MKSIVFLLILVLLVGGLSRRPRPTAPFSASADRIVNAAAWLAAVYVVLYLSFG